MAKLKVEQRGDTERPRLLAYLAELTSSQHLRRVLQGDYIVVECGSAEEVEHELTGRLYDGLVIGRFHKDGTSCIDFVQRVRRKFPSVAIVLYSMPAPSLFHEIVDFSRAGIDDVVLRDADDMRRVLARTVAMAAEAALARQAMAVLELLLTPNVQRLVRACLEQSDGHIGVASLARALRVTRKTLANWCRDASAPSPEAMVGWSRVLRAARMLEDPGRSIEAVAIAKHFGSASALDNMFRRYLNESPSAVRRRGAVEVVLKRWAEQVAK